MDNRPRYAKLPTRDGVDHAAWGIWGDNDQVGAFNLQTSAGVIEAARLVRKGSVFALNWELELPSPPLYGRGAICHSISSFPPDDWGHDDWYDNFYPQVSSQWDGLTHVGVGGGVFYNGVQKEEVTGASNTRNGIEHWARRGIAGRFVLLDYIRWHEANHGELARDAAFDISPENLEACRRAQHVEYRTGDVLLIRTGWMEWYERQGEERRRQLSAGSVRFPGLAPTEATAAYLWDNGFCAVASDNPALESGPSRTRTPGRIFLHYYLLGRFGMAIGEMFYLEQLAADCANDRVYEGLFTSAPLNKLGGVGSPPNALALK